MMIEEFKAFIQGEELCKLSDKILLSVSGGPDSVCLVHLFHQSGYEIGLAHCNYQLRGDDADGDESFVKELAHALDTPFFSISFPTRKRAEEEKKSIQEVARDLRYDWLEGLRQEEGYTWIATGHQFDDSVETVLFNLAKGCGIRGLHGILPKQGKLIRPLLFTGKSRIIDFLDAEGISYRRDLSNQELYYDRNKIRHGVIPVLKSINPNFSATSRRTLQNLREVEKFYKAGIERWIVRVVQVYAGGLRISWEELNKSPAPPTLLYEIMAAYGFGRDQVQSVLARTELQPGKQWSSPTHRLLSDRDALLLEAIPDQEIEPIQIGPEDLEVSTPDGTLFMEQLSAPPAQFRDSSWEAILDARKIQFPLRLRRWKPGDYFHPLGMNGKRKKLQDFFSDKKLSLFEKEKVWVLESSGQIAWLVGHRIDESFKLRPDSTACWRFRFEKNK